MEADQRYHQKSVFPLLVVESNKDHQLLIGYCLRARIPQAEPFFAATVKEATYFLELASTLKNTFPKLVILDPFLPGLPLGLALLKDIRTRFPLLPVVLLSSQQDQSLVNEAYQLGANSFIAKPGSLDEWENSFNALKEYWLGIVTLSNER